MNTETTPAPRTQAQDDALVISALIEPAGYHAQARHGLVELLDEDGDSICSLPDELVQFLVALAEQEGTQGDVIPVVQWLDKLMASQWQRGYERGRGAGRDELAAAAQQLLGIDKICNAIAAGAAAGIRNDV